MLFLSLPECKKFQNFVITLEKGPWQDDGSGLVIFSQSMIEMGLTEGWHSYSDKRIVFNSSLSSLETQAQEKANEQGVKIALVISGVHQSFGDHRAILQYYFPQIKAVFKTPLSMHVELKKLSACALEGNTLDHLAEQFKDLIPRFVMYTWNYILNNTLNYLYHTHTLVPEPPPGFILKVWTQEHGASANDIFWAIKEGTHITINNHIMEEEHRDLVLHFNCVKKGDINVPQYSYFFKDGCWNVNRFTCWWENFE